MKIDPTQSVKNQVKNYVKIREGLRHSLPFQHGGKQCCSCVNSLVSFGVRGARLTRQLPKLRRKGYWIIHFGCCITRNREKTFRFVLTFYRQATDRLPTHYQLSADCRPTVGRQVTYISGKTCWPSVSYLSADKRPTVGRQATNSQPTAGRQLTDSRPTGFLGSSSSQLPVFQANGKQW